VSSSGLAARAYDEFVVLSVHPFPHALFWPLPGSDSEADENHNTSNSGHCASATYVSPIPLQFALGENSAACLSTGFLVSPLESRPGNGSEAKEPMLEQQSLLVSLLEYQQAQDAIEKAAFPVMMDIDTGESSSKSDERQSASSCARFNLGLERVLREYHDLSWLNVSPMAPRRSSPMPLHFATTLRLVAVLDQFESS